MTCFDKKNFSSNSIISFFKDFIVNAIFYGQIYLVLAIPKNTFYLGILLYKSFAKTYLFFNKLTSSNWFKAILLSLYKKFLYCYSIY